MGAGLYLPGAYEGADPSQISTDPTARPPIVSPGLVLPSGGQVGAPSVIGSCLGVQVWLWVRLRQPLVLLALLLELPLGGSMAALLWLGTLSPRLLCRTPRCHTQHPMAKPASALSSPWGVGGGVRSQSGKLPCPVSLQRPPGG